MISDAQKQTLIRAAREIRQRAYAPYSNFAVGAAMLAEDGTIYTGVNIENASYGLTVCAERNAIGNMVTAGQTKFIAAAVATSNGVTPCGACRQVMLEFADDVPVWIINEDKDTIRQTTLYTLLPDFFDNEQLSMNNENE